MNILYKNMMQTINLTQSYIIYLFCFYIHLYSELILNVFYIFSYPLECLKSS